MARNGLTVVVTGSLGSLGTVWVAGVAVAAGGDMPLWTVPVAVGVLAVAFLVAWVLQKVSHGGDWAGGRRHRPRVSRGASRLVVSQRA